MNVLSRRALPTAVVVVLLASLSPLPAQISLSDATAAAGVTHQHSPALDHPGNPMHAGGTVGDFNNDGRPDLFVLGGGGGPDRLFLNQGGTFVDAAAAWGLTALYRGTGAVAGDYDNDGWQDIFVTSYGDMPGPPSTGAHRLYRNLGGTGFEEVAAAAGVDRTGIVPGGWSPVFGDYDLDGDLDLFVCDWVNNSEGNRLFKNKGNGTFRDVTVSAGVYIQWLKGFSPRFVDMNGDRYPELLIAADFGTSQYFVNNRDGSFTNYTAASQTGDDDNGMGHAVADFNRDGLFDWMVTSIYGSPPGGGFLSGNRLYVNQGNDLCPPLPESAGANDGGWGWGVTAIDLDHDGFQDLVGTNGWPLPSFWGQDPSWVFHNQGNLSFVSLPNGAGMNHAGQGRGLYHLDYDADGDMDVVILSYREPLKLFCNDLVPGGNSHWIQIDLDSSANPGLAPNGMGSRIQLTAGGVTQYAFVDGGATYLGRSQLTAHFGLGSAAVVDELIVEWADGFRTVLTNLPVDDRYTVSAQLPMVQDPLVRGSTAEFRVSGLRPGEFVQVLYSRSEGPGRCKPALGGLCIDLLSPVFAAGASNADAQGNAVITAQVPPSAPLTSVTTQAVVPRGANGRESAKTNTVTAPILP